jgi:hypothetical protein
MKLALPLSTEAQIRIARACKAAVMRSEGTSDTAHSATQALRDMLTQRLLVRELYMKGL